MMKVSAFLFVLLTGVAVAKDGAGQVYRPTNVTSQDYVVPEAKEVSSPSSLQKNNLKF